MPANVQTMAYVGEVPWHRQGAAVPPDVSAEEMIQAAGLDWGVEKRPARGYPPIKRKRKPDTYAKYELVRMPRENTNEQEIVLGMVSDRYEPLQNAAAFQFFDALVDRKVATFETQPDLQEPGVKGSLWAAYNAVTGFEDYRQARDETAQKRLDRVWFGAGAELKAKAFDEAVRIAEAA